RRSSAGRLPSGCATASKRRTAGSTIRWRRQPASGACMPDPTAMTNALAIALAQLNPTVGDIQGNLARIREARARAAGCDLLVCAELALIGYPPEDLVMRPSVLEATRRAVEALAADTTTGPATLVTTPWREGGVTYNAVILLEGGRIAAVRYKYELPNYGVFDEKRVFAAGPLPDVIEFRGV